MLKSGVLKTIRTYKNKIKKKKWVIVELTNLSTITRFIADKASDQPTSRLPAATNGQDLVRLAMTRVLLILYEHNSVIWVRKFIKTIQPVFVSQKINQHLKFHEARPPLVNQQSLVYQFKCDLMQVMLALHDGTYINAWTNIDTPLLLLASISVTTFFDTGKSHYEFYHTQKNARASFTASSILPFAFNREVWTFFSLRFTFQMRQFPTQLYRLDQWKCFVWSTKLWMFIKEM